MKIEAGDTVVLVLRSSRVSVGAIFSARKNQPKTRSYTHGARG